MSIEEFCEPQNIFKEKLDELLNKLTKKDTVGNEDIQEVVKEYNQFLAEHNTNPIDLENNPLEGKKEINILKKYYNGEINNEEAIRQLKDELKNCGFSYGAAALIFMGERAIEPLLKGIESKNPIIRENSSWALSLCGGIRAILPLIK